MKVIRKLLVFLLALSLAVAAAAWTVAGTAMNADYLKAATVKAGLAGQLSRAIPAVLAARGMAEGVSQATAAGAAGEASSAAVSLLNDAFNEQFIQTQADSIIDQGIARYVDGAAAPITLDLRDIRPQLVASGIALPADTKAMLDAPQPLPLGGLDIPLTAAATAVKTAQMLTLLAAAVIAVILFLLGGHRRFSALARGLTGGAFVALLFAGLAWLPAALTGLILSAPPGKEFAPAVSSLFSAIAGDQTVTILWMAGAMVALSAVLFVAHALFGHRKKKSEG